MNNMEIIPILFWVILIAALVYLTIRRIKIKKTEDFEKRDN